MSKPMRAFAAIATPFGGRLEVLEPQLLAHARWLIEKGCDGVVLFGSTGESASLSSTERRSILERLLAGGIAAERIIVGTGCCSIADTVDLTRHALSSGVKTTLIHPPFFFKNVSDAGVESFYDEVIDRVGDDKLRVLLYHFPQTVGVSISAALARKIKTKHTSTIVGYKDSSGDWQNSLGVVQACPDLDVFVGTEARLVALAEAGGAGCISATANVQPDLIRALLNDIGRPEAAQRQQVVAAVRGALEKVPLVSGVKALLAQIHGAPQWSRPRPPLMPLNDEQSATLWNSYRAARGDA